MKTVKRHKKINLSLNVSRIIDQKTETYKTNYWLQIYSPCDNSTNIVIEDFFNKKRFLLDNSAFFYVLNYCDIFKPRKNVTEYIKKELDLTQKDAEDIFNELLQYNLLITRSSLSYVAEKKAKLWKKYGWNDALDYFIAIKDYPFLDYESTEARNVDNGLMDKYIKTDPVPPIYKEYKNAKKIPLERNFSSLNDIDLRTLLFEKVFDHESGKEPLTKTQISNVLFNTFGEMGTVEFPVQGEFLLKTSPSGGARHPIEAYMISLDTGFPTGIYHYSVKTNSLEEISSEVDVSEINDIIYKLNTGPQFSIKAVIVFSAIFPRSMWRYREPRSYRVILHDLGHILETMKIISKAFNIKTYFGHGFHESRLANLLNISGQEEAILHYAVLS